MWPKFYLCPHSWYFLLSGCRPSEAYCQQGTAGAGPWLKCRAPESRLLALSYTAATFYLAAKYQALRLLSHKSEPDFSILAGFVCLPPHWVPSRSTLINTTQGCLWCFCCFQSASPQRLWPGHLTSSTAFLSLSQL